MATNTHLYTTLGLSENESQVYDSLLKKSHQTASEIALHSSMKRTTTYGSIESLLRKGYISARKKSSKTIYIPQNPTVFVKQLEQEKDKLVHKMDVLEKSLPALQKMYQSDTIFPQIQTFEGSQSVLDIREHIFESLKKHKIGYAIGTASMLYNAIGEDTYSRKFSQRRRQLAGTKMYHIVDRNDFDMKRARQGEGDFHEFRFLPQTYPHETHMIIIGSQLYILKLTDPVTCIIIDSPEIVKAYMFMWQAMWDTSTIA